MPLDPQIKVVLDQIAALRLPPHYEVGAVQARANAASRPRTPGPEVASVENWSIAGPDGQVPIRIYKPAGDGPFPAIVWAHGGGMVIGPLLLSIGMEPQVGTSSCAFMILWTAFSGVVIYGVDGKLGAELAIWCVGFGFIWLLRW